MIQDRNGPIINLDASARSANRIFLFHQRFLLFENVCFFSFLFFSSKSGDCVSNYASVGIFFFKFFFFFLFWPSHIRVSEYIFFVAIQTARLFQYRAPLSGRFIVCKSWFIEALIYLRLCPQKFCFLLIRSSNCLIYYIMFQTHQLPSFCLFHVACMYTTEEEPANKL